MGGWTWRRETRGQGGGWGYGPGNTQKGHLSGRSFRLSWRLRSDLEITVPAPSPLQLRRSPTLPQPLTALPLLEQDCQPFPTHTSLWKRKDLKNLKDPEEMDKWSAKQSNGILKIFLAAPRGLRDLPGPGIEPRPWQ